MADSNSASGSSPARPERTPSPSFLSDTTARASSDGLPPPLPRRHPSPSSVVSYFASNSPPPRPSHVSNAAHRAAHRHSRSSGGFLLADALDGAGGYDSGTGLDRTGSTAGHTRSTRHSLGKSRGSGSRANGSHGSVLHGGSVRRAESPEASASSPSVADAAAVRAGTPDSPAASAALAVDSAQIVNMALKLSETRRLAANHRPLSASPAVQTGGTQTGAQPLPPRLTPLPDSAVGGSLRHQLQQQRRLSRTASPRPDKGHGGGSRATSASFVASPDAATTSGVPGLQPAFDPVGDASSTSTTFHYNFTPSTLARAQKAKDYLELLGQHRRLLNLLPPLTPPPAPTSSRSRATSFSSLPLGSSNSNTEHPAVSNAPAPHGRPYNPLQYIRNRKVRARERKTIDGQAQGFGDVAKTTAWVGEVAKWAATLSAMTATDPRGTTLSQLAPLPPFPRADQHASTMQSSPPPPTSSTSRAAVAAGAGAIAKPKRARLDWDIDPADMLADLYWLEQDDNKKFVEDRHWRRVFPQDPSLYRPHSRRTDKATPDPRTSQRGDHHHLDSQTSPLSALEADLNNPVLQLPPLFVPQSPPLEDASDQDWGYSARQRARQSAHQKLQELRGFRHRHPGSLRSHSRDHRLRLRRDSFSDTSDSDSDGRRKRPKVATGSWQAAADPSYGTANDKEPLQENRDGERGREDSRNQRFSGSSVSPQAATQNSTSGGGARSSLETPRARRRLSVEYESSQPTSPEMNPLAGTALGFVPTLGDSLSTPSSRTTSPVRHHHQRFSKVKNIFRDHSHERDRSLAAADRTSDERDTERGGGGGNVGDLPKAATLQRHQSSDVAAAAGASAAEGVLTYPLSTTTTATTNGHGRGRGSRSPIRKSASAAARPSVPGTFAGGHRTHEKTDSLWEFRSEGHAGGIANTGAGDGSGTGSATSSGFRGLMRGPRLGTMLQGGVSKVSDMFWRRGPPGSDPSASSPVGANEPPTGESNGQNGQSLGGTASTAEVQASLLDSSSDEDFDATGAKTSATPATARRGRSRKSALCSRSPSAHLHVPGEDDVSSMARPAATGAAAGAGAGGDKQHHYLDVMPMFGRGDGAAVAEGDPIVRPPSRQSARFERLKPPRIDVSDASPMASPDQELGGAPPSFLGLQSRRGSQLDSDMSEADGRAVSRSRRSSHVSHTSHASRASLSLAGKGGGTSSPQQHGGRRGNRPFGSISTASVPASAPASIFGDRQERWSVSQPVVASGESLSRRNLARLRASLYSTAVLSQELERRVHEPRVLVSSGWTPGRRRLDYVSRSGGGGGGDGSSDDSSNDSSGGDNDEDDVAVHTGTETDPEDVLFPEGPIGARDGKKRKNRKKKDGRRGSRGRKSVVVVRGSGGAPLWNGHAPAQVLTWADVAAYAPDPEAVAWRPVKLVELYPLAGQVLGGAVQRQGQAWQASAEAFTGQTAPQLRARIEQVRTRVAGELSDGARLAADAADEVNRDLVAVQRLQVKRVLDSIDKMLRQRRQRFRWVRRAGWLTVEWVLVGFMWYVWFLVMLVRVVLGAVGGVVAGVRWLLWL